MEEGRLKRLLTIFVVLSLAVIGKVVYSVFISGRAFSYAFLERVPARSGTIYDVDGRVLAADLLRYVAYLDRDYLLKRKGESELARLATVLKLDVRYLRERRFPVLMRSNLERSILATVPSDLIRFVSIEKEYERFSISSSSFATYLNRIEEYHKDLVKKKRDGYVSRDLVSKDRRVVEPVNGYDLHLTVDMDIQRAADMIIENAVRKYQAKDGLIIVMESQTGAIKAVASTYDWPFAAQGYFEPGSSLKPIIYAIALEEGEISTSTIFHCIGEIQPLPNSSVVIHDIDAHGTVTTVDALVRSCNVASVQISKRIAFDLGLERYYWWLRRFGLGELTGVDIPNETSGSLPEPSRWYDTFFAHLAIGQGIGVSGFQLIRAFNTVVTSGLLVTPHFLHTVSGPKEAKSLTYPTKRVISRTTALAVRRMLEKVVTVGTGVKAQVSNLRVGGKTGTAQKASGNGYVSGRYYSIFLGFFPMEDPEYTVLVLLDEPSAGYFGGDVAAPVFAEVVEAISKQSIEGGRATTCSVVKGLVPDFHRLTVKEAQLLASVMELDAHIQGRGIVVWQSVEPGRIYKEPLSIALRCEFGDE